jgi:hypothetical protein
METPRKRYRSAPFNPVLDLDSFLSLTGADVVEPDPFAAIIGEMWCTGPSIAGSPIHEPASSQVEAVWPLNDGNSTENAEGEDGEVEALSDMCETDELEPAPQLGLAKIVKRKSKPPPGPHEHGVPSKYTCFRNKICSGKVVLADNVPLQHGDTAKCCKDGHLNAYCAVCDGFFDTKRVVLFPKPNFKYKRNGQHCAGHPPRQRNGGRKYVNEPTVRRRECLPYR